MGEIDALEMFDPVWFSSFVKDIQVFLREGKKKKKTITREAGQRRIKKQTNKCKQTKT